MHETTKRICLYSYPYIKVAKMPCFPYYLLSFFLNTIEEGKGRTVSACRQSWGGGGAMMAQIMYTHVSNYKNNE
jgi:hypothetical protein